MSGLFPRAQGGGRVRTQRDLEEALSVKEG